VSKKILIVTGSDYTDQVYEAFHDTGKLGHKLYLLSDGSFEPKPGVFEKHFKYDLRKTREALDYMKKQPEHFDAVAIKTSEWLTPLTALLARHYKVIGNTPLTAFICRSKYHMRQRMKNAGLPIPGFSLCKNYGELRDAIDKIGLPCVAKPVGANASYGTFMLRSQKDLDDLKNRYDNSIRYLEKMAIDKDIFAFSEEEMRMIGIEEPVNMVTDYLIEEFMEGHEISIDALTQKGRTTIMGIADQIRMKPPYFVQLAEYMPFMCDKVLLDSINKLVKKTIDAMGITDSPSHTELIIKDGGLKIVEIGCRIGGDNIHDAVYQTTGYNLMYEAIMIALGIERHYSIKAPLCHTAMEYLLPQKEGIIKNIQIPSEPKNLNITELVIEAETGKRVAKPPKSFDFVGYICVKGRTAEEAEHCLKKSMKEVKVEIE
jgi:biotin carboxylase